MTKFYSPSTIKDNCSVLATGFSNRVRWLLPLPMVSLAPPAGQSRGRSATGGLSCRTSRASFPKADPSSRTGKISRFSGLTNVAFVVMTLTLPLGSCLPTVAQTCDGAPTFQFYPTFHWQLRRRVLTCFQQAARKVTLRPFSLSVLKCSTYSFLGSQRSRARNHPGNCESSHTRPG